ASLTAWTLAQGHAAEAVRTIIYATLMLANLGLILSNLSHQPLRQRLGAPAFGWTALATSAALAAVLFTPSLRELFLFAPLNGPALMLIAAVALGCFAAFEAVHVFAVKAQSPRRP